LRSGGVQVEVAGRTIAENGQSFTEDIWVDAVKPFVDYKVKMTAFSVTGCAATMVSPVFDDITIIYFLPKEEIILTEKMHD